jgi:hypothetical protein
MSVNRNIMSKTLYRHLADKFVSMGSGGYAGSTGATRMVSLARMSLLSNYWSYNQVLHIIGKLLMSRVQKTLVGL